MTTKFADVDKTGIDYTTMPIIKVTKRKRGFNVPCPASPPKKSDMPRWSRKTKPPDKALNKPSTSSAVDVEGCGEGSKQRTSPRTPSPSFVPSRRPTTPILESLRRTLSSSSQPQTSTPRKNAPQAEDVSAPLTVNLDDIVVVGEDAGSITSDAAPRSPTPPPEDAPSLRMQRRRGGRKLLLHGSPNEPRLSWQNGTRSIRSFTIARGEIIKTARKKEKHWRTRLKKSTLAVSTY